MAGLGKTKQILELVSVMSEKMDIIAGQLKEISDILRLFCSQKQSMPPDFDDSIPSHNLDPCLLDVVDSVKSPLRMPICDFERSTSQGQVSACGKLEAGAIRPGSKILVMPSGDQETVRSLERDSQLSTSVLLPKANETSALDDDAPVPAAPRNLQKQMVMPSGDQETTPPPAPVQAIDFDALKKRCSQGEKKAGKMHAKKNVIKHPNNDEKEVIRKAAEQVRVRNRKINKPQTENNFLEKKCEQTKW